MAEIYSIVYSPNDGTPVEPPSHFHRVPTQSAMLIANYGIEDDRKGGNPARNLNIMTHEITLSFGREGFKANPGALGEQIIITELNLAALEPGTRVRLGSDALIEIVKPRTGCERFEAIQGHPREQAKGRLGAMARVLIGGMIRVGDPVSLIGEPVKQTP